MIQTIPPLVTATTETQVHEIVALDPKPSPERIRELNGQHFNSSVQAYDQSGNPSKRQLYVDTVNRLISGFLGQETDICKVLSIGAGTGCREQAINQFIRSRMRFTCIDISSEMCALAKERGHETVCGAWDTVDLGKTQFDSALMLNSFGQLSSKEERSAALTKINKHLRYQGSFYFDVFNLKDEDERGPELEQRFEREDWVSKGYEKGDAFFRAPGSPSISFWHYFTKDEVEGLLRSTGFRLSRILNVAHDAEIESKILSSSNRGNLLVRAIKVADAT